MSRTLTIGTRGSKLALAQTDLIRVALEAAHPDLEIRIERITTRGDVILDRPLSAIGDKGLFVTEIEEALRTGQVDLAVHSAKDLPSAIPADMALAAFPPRADARDVVISRDGTPLAKHPAGARIGTSSLRRACQIRALRPDVEIRDLRGNVDTRLNKLAGDEYEAIVLAAAGLARLGVVNAPTEFLEPEVMIPAAGQGVLAIETRADDETTNQIVTVLDDQMTRWAILAERAFLGRIGGGCQVPIGAYARIDGERLTIAAMVGAPDGRIVRATYDGAVEDAESLGVAIADDVLARGGRALLDASRSE